MCLSNINNLIIQIEGMAGEKMLEAGCVQLWDKNLANVMGFSEVLKKLPALLRLQKVIIHYFSTSKPDVFIGVDAPAFNFLTISSFIFCFSSLSSARFLFFNTSCLVMVDFNSASTASLKPCCPTITIDLRVQKMIDEIVNVTQAHLIQVIGNVMVIYRAFDKEPQIILPRK
jgi:hypothetical protein